MLLAILLGIALGLLAAWLRRGQLAAPLAIAVFVVAALVLLTVADDDEVWVLAGAMLAASGLVDVLTAEANARAFGAVLAVAGLVLIAVG